MTQLTLSAIDNKNLFSNYYLDNQIKNNPKWKKDEPVEELTNKTAIKEYYEAGFDAVAGALAKNKKKLKDGYDPTSEEDSGDGWAYRPDSL
jgi:hypothetical protein